MRRAGAQPAPQHLSGPAALLPSSGPTHTSFSETRGCRCNPSGAVLTPVADNVWGAERPFTWNRIDVGGRGAVIRLSDGTIWTQARCCRLLRCRARATTVVPSLRASASVAQDIAFWRRQRGC